MSGLVLMLSPKGPSLNGSGGNSDLKNTDICAALSMLHLNEFETCYIRARILDAEKWGIGTPLELMGWDLAITLAIEHSWTIPRGEELVRRAMFEVMNSRIDPKVEQCGGCRGAGIRRSKDKKLVACTACDKQEEDKHGQLVGNGKRRISNREYARRLGVSDKTFKATWEPRMRVMKSALLRIEEKARHLPGVVFDDEDE